MQMKLSDVRVRYQNLMQLSAKKLPHKMAYAIAKNLLKLETEFKLTEERRKEMIDSYAVKDDAGAAVVKNGKYDFGDKEDEFNKEFEDFLATETEVDIHMIPSEVLETLEDARYDVLTPAEMVALDFMIAEE